MPSSGALSRAERPLIEEVRNPSGLVMGRETWMDDPSEIGYYDPSMKGAEMDYEPNETKRRVFDSLKRHALMNLQLGNRKFACGGKTEKKIIKGEEGLKTPYHSAFAQRSTRKGVYSTHRVYPDANNPEAYVERRWWSEKPDLYYDYNPSNLDFKYDDYDYSNTVPVEGDLDYNYNEWRDSLRSEYDAAIKNGWLDRANPYETFNPGQTPAEEIKRRLKGNYRLYIPPTRADGSTGINQFDLRWQGPKVFDNYTF